MVLSRKDRHRAEELARELLKITGGRFRDDGTSKTFAEIEDEAIEVTDVVASLLIQQSAKGTTDQPTPCRCPQCGSEPRNHDDDDDEPVILQTDRGDVEFLAEGYYCRRCRRSFFPSAR